MKNIRFLSYVLACLNFTGGVITVLVAWWVKRLPLVLTYDQWISWINISFFVRVACLIGIVVSILVICLGISMRQYPRSRFFQIGFVSIFLFVGALILDAPSMRVRRLNSDGWCLFYMRRIELAKDMLVDFHQAVTGVPINQHVIDSFLGFKAICPSGGHYDYGVIGTMPECSIHGSLKRRWVFEEPRIGGISRIGYSGIIEVQRDSVTENKAKTGVGKEKSRE
ncbi:MAG: hypothetical protein WC381_09105 [Kiritimatiellia bacterium]|jgi:uncharacterized Tic20 family protein